MVLNRVSLELACPVADTSARKTTVGLLRRFDRVVLRIRLRQLSICMARYFRQMRNLFLLQRTNTARKRQVRRRNGSTGEIVVDGLSDIRQSSSSVALSLGEQWDLYPHGLDVAERVGKNSKRRAVVRSGSVTITVYCLTIAGPEGTAMTTQQPARRFAHQRLTS